MGKETRKERAQKALKEAEKTTQAREKTIKLVGGVVVAALVVGIIGLAVVVSNTNKPPSLNVAPDSSAAVPVGVYDSTAQYPYGVLGEAYDEGLPTLEIWEDFQCPACGALEQANGEYIQQLAFDKKINLVYRPTSFLDSSGNNNSSKRAISAWGCAIDQGKNIEYHNEVYKNQPQGKAGWSDEELLQYGKNVGIDGSSYDEFSQCVADLTYVNWAVNSTQIFYDEEIQSTPTVLLNGVKIPNEIAATPELLNEAIANSG
jgi:protein-disulfide isomerase